MPKVYKLKFRFNNECFSSLSYLQMTLIFILGRHNTKQSQPSSEVISLLTIFYNTCMLGKHHKSKNLKSYIHGISPFFILLLCLTYRKQFIFFVHFVLSSDLMSAPYLMLTTLKTCLFLFYQQFSS